MNSSDVIVNIKCIKDVDNITTKTKYINLSIENIDNDVIEYFLLHGKDYLYSDTIDNRNGFIYANYDMFKTGETLISNIILNMPNDLNDIERIRYIYISLGKILCTDINILDDKNETISFDKISILNNIWGALTKRKISNTIISKIFMYVCFRIGIKSELICSNIKGNIANKIYINDSSLIVDLYKDIHNIQGRFCTKYFDKYNNDKIMDKKILYINDEYTDYYLDIFLKKIDYTDENVVEEILFTTSNIIDINAIGPYELYQMYRNIFDKYTPNYDIKINNLFICKNFAIKEHFTLFSYNDRYYSYNYNKGNFINIDYTTIYNNIRDNKIGVYLDEDFNLIEERVIL